MKAKSQLFLSVKLIPRDFDFYSDTPKTRPVLRRFPCKLGHIFAVQFDYKMSEFNTPKTRPVFKRVPCISS